MLYPFSFILYFYSFYSVYIELANLTHLFLLTSLLIFHFITRKKKYGDMFSDIFFYINYSLFNGTPLRCSCLENPMDGRAWWDAVHGVPTSRTQLSNFTFTFHFHAVEKEVATHSSVLAWRIPGTGEPGGLPSMGSHRVGHDWSDLAAAVAFSFQLKNFFLFESVFLPFIALFLLAHRLMWFLILFQCAIIFNHYFLFIQFYNVIFWIVKYFWPQF